MVRKRLAARALLPVGAGRHPVPMGRHGRMDRKSRLLRHDHYRTARRPAVRLAQRQPEIYRRPAALRVGRDIGPVSHRRRLSAVAGDLLLYRLHFWHFQRDYVRFLRRCGAPVLYRTVAFGFPHVQPQVGTGRTGILEAARHAAQLGAFARRTGIYGTALPLFCENRRHLVAAPRGYRLPRLRLHADRRSRPSRPDPAEQTLLRLVL